MVKISRNEMEYLVTKGVKYHEDGITSTKSKHSGRTWYLTETKDNMAMLKKYRDSIVVGK